MDRRGGPSVASFLVDVPLRAGTVVSLPDAAGRHVRVRRLRVGDAVRLADGAGTVARGIIGRLDRKTVDVELHDLDAVPRPVPLTLLAPVADRERTLWLAEKAAELAVTDWHPIEYARSRSVSPRGHGAAFARRLRSRMASALEQSGAAWLPVVHPEQSLEDAMAGCGDCRGFVLERGGMPLPSMAPFGPTAVAIGPEGGLDPEERNRLASGEWQPVSLGPTTLRFETAAIAAAAVVRAAQGP